MSEPDTDTDQQLADEVALLKGKVANHGASALVIGRVLLDSRLRWRGNLVQRTAHQP